MAKPNLTPPNLTEQDIQRFWSKVHIAAPDECWEWQAATTSSGYGNFGAQGSNYSAHKVAVFLTTRYWSMMVIRHHCDNRICCNPVHLIEGTQKQNAEDKKNRGRDYMFRGENNKTAKLSDSSVKDIREAYAMTDETIISLARRYGVSASLIDLIVKGIIWTHLPIRAAAKKDQKGERHHNATLSDNQVVEIKKQLHYRSPKSIAVEFGVSIQIIRNILKNRTWRHIKS